MYPMFNVLSTYTVLKLNLSLYGDAEDMNRYNYTGNTTTVLYFNIALHEILDIRRALSRSAINFNVLSILCNDTFRKSAFKKDANISDTDDANNNIILVLLKE